MTLTTSVKPKCVGCGQPFERDGYVFCSETCADRFFPPDPCAGCGKELPGQFYFVDGERYHRDCSPLVLVDVSGAGNWVWLRPEVKG